MRNVLVATPSYDGGLNVWYVNSLLNAKMLCAVNEINLVPIFMSGDALVQRARNDLVRIAVEEDFESMIFIDSDMEFDPQWVLDLINRDEYVVGGTTRKKTDNEEAYVVKTEDPSLAIEESGLIKVTAVGTGFVKLSREAFTALWESSEPYQNEGKECRMVFNVGVHDGQLYSEDTAMYLELERLGIDVWLDPRMTCNHIGSKKFEGNFMAYRERLLQELEGASSTDTQTDIQTDKTEE